MTDKFAQYLRNADISVGTHNRKIRRLKRIFEVLKEYRNTENPFIVMSLRRKEREEQDSLAVRRMSFNRKQEARLLEVLEDIQH
jgi:uncharacterized Ntn-hydrolase superfamily protein